MFALLGTRRTKYEASTEAGPVYRAVHGISRSADWGDPVSIADEARAEAERLYELLADRLGEHPQAFNKEVADSGEYETYIRSAHVESLAEFLTPTVIEWLSSRKVEAAPSDQCPECLAHGGAHTQNCDQYVWNQAAPSDTDREAAQIIDAELARLAHGELSLEGTPGEWIAQRLVAAGFSRTSQPVQVAPESLAAKLYSIEYQVDPDSATPDDIDERLGAADELIAWFAEHALSQPVQVEVTDDMVRRGAIALYVREFNFPPDAEEQATEGFAHHYEKPARVALSAALGGSGHE